MSDIPERTIKGVKVRLIRDNCIGTGSCNHIAPEVFELDETQTVSFVDPIGDIERERVIEGCDVCPVEALQALDEDGNSLLP